MSDSIASILSIGTIETAKRRPETAVASSGRISSFEKILATMIDRVSPDPPSSIYEVKKGDTLSAICQKAMTADGKTPSYREIAAVVEKVAQANHLQSADRINIGQKLDLAAVSAQGAGRGGRSKSWNPKLSDITGIIKRMSQPGAINNLSIVESGGTVTSEYGLRLNPFSKKLERHEGIDFAATYGTGVFAAMPGKVVFSGRQPGYGKTVIIRHDDGSETLYAHNSSNLVKVGQQIDVRTPIAKVGSTGNSTGPHVHFEWRRNGQAVNPIEQFDRQLLQVTKALEGLDVLS